MKWLALGFVLLLVCAPAFAQDAVQRVLDRTIASISYIESQTPGEEVLSLICDKGDDGRVSVYYRRHCPVGSVLDELVFGYTAGDAWVYDQTSCSGATNPEQFLIIWGSNKDREVAELGRAFNALCRELPFDDAATCQ